MSAKQELFSADGPLAERIPDFVHRPVQVEMADCVEEIITSGINGLIEAGTGTGKTLAYLMPVLNAGKTTIISTGTRTLQDQLFFKDLPAVLPLARSRIRTALLKGRRNYLCPERLGTSLRVAEKNRSREVMAQLTAIRQWATSTRSGDLMELTDLSESSPVLPLVTSTVDNCLGSRCPKYDECPLYRARAKVLDADIIVVNHHLLFADMALKEDSSGRLLPPVDTIVVDEAHQVQEIARQFFGTRIGSGQMIELAADVRREMFLFGNDDAALVGAMDRLERTTRHLEKIVLTDYPNVGLDSLLSGADTARAVSEVDEALMGAIDGLERASVRSLTFANCYSRAIDLGDRFAMLTEDTDLDGEFVHWLDRRQHGFDIHLSPVSIAGEMHERINTGDCTWLFTSATLTVGGSFNHSRLVLGLDDDAIERRFESPFVFREQVKGWLPAGLPSPGTDDHTRALVATVLPVIRKNPGRTFFLVTSYRALRLAADQLSGQGVPLLVQGTTAKHTLLERFARTEHAVLLATQSFWEGVDVRGASLRCLIIDKLPFMSPEDPLSSALMSALERSGSNGFMDYLLPRAVITLKQGFGRLIRQETDEGLFVMGDERMMNRSYGRIFRTSLADMEWLEDRESAIEYLAGLDHSRQGAAS
ncbi:MAG: ATP-dependent DNA helicase [Pseudomonadales bacterium]|nr:ATP-dependent DNA helicase [Pseudomonadales bacterium]